MEVELRDQKKGISVKVNLSFLPLVGDQICIFYRNVSFLAKNRIFHLKESDSSQSTKIDRLTLYGVHINDKAE